MSTATIDRMLVERGITDENERALLTQIIQRRLELASGGEA